MTRKTEHKYIYNGFFMQSSRTYLLPLYYILLEILLCVLYVYLSLFWGNIGSWLESLSRTPLRTKWLEVERGAPYL